MRTSELIKNYLVARRAQGAKFKSAERTFYQFARETGDVPLADVTPQAVSAFLHGHGKLSGSWATKYGLLTGLYRFAIARGHVVASALPDRRPRLPPSITPYVYSHDELQRLLDATEAVASPLSPLRALTYRTLLLLIYAAGLRVSEALNLDLRDLNRLERLLTVRNTKFYKTRLVPIGKDAATALDRYLDHRCLLPMPQGDQSALFASRSGHRLGYSRLSIQFQRVRAHAGIGCPTGEQRPPRIHDLRHTAAVHRVVAWYREGKDVQTLLPQLATYLGHACIASTQRYLTMTPDLLHEASMRFASYADIQSGTESCDA